MQEGSWQMFHRSMEPIFHYPIALNTSHSFATAPEDRCCWMWRLYALRMSQRHFIQNDRTMLITTVTLHRKPIFADPACAREAVECLYRVQGLHPFFLYGFVIMPDHCHFLLFVQAPYTVSKLVCAYKSGLAFDLGIKPLWQRRFHCRIVRDPGSALAYVHENPMKAGFVVSPIDYPWSSASGRWNIDPWRLQ